MRMLDLLDRSCVKATFFILGWTAERYPTLARCILAAGHELGCHSYAHRLIYHQTPAEFREDTRRAKGVIEDLTGQPVHGYRAPSFSITKQTLWVLPILAQEGFTYDSSIFPIRRDRYGIPSAPRHPFRIDLSHPSHPERNSTILEAPPSTVEFLGTTLPVGGGGYLRLMPGWVFRRAVSRIVERERRPAILYLHPWELDPKQPRIRSASRLSRFRHYINLHTTEIKLRTLLTHRSFTDLASVLKQLGPLPIFPLAALPGRTCSST